MTGIQKIQKETLKTATGNYVAQGVVQLKRTKINENGTTRTSSKHEI